MLMHQAGVLAELSSMVMPLSFIICALVVIYLVGMADDLVGVKYRAKFVAQIICALLICSGGIILDDFHGFLSLQILPNWVAVLLTVILTVFITNAINLIDGIDGLASGLSAIACLFYAWVFYGVGLYLYSVLAVATLGALVPFFLYNVWGNVTKHRKIFMGDTGALTIGLILSVLSIRICLTEATRPQWRLPRCSYRASTLCASTCIDSNQAAIPSYPTRPTSITSCLPWACVSA